MHKCVIIFDENTFKNPQNMNRILFFFIVVFGCSYVSNTYAQVKVGNNPSLIHGSSILELESINKALVITRVTNNQMNAMIPLHGALVYNTEQQCVFVFKGNWESLCNDTATTIKVTTANIAPATNNNKGDFWINDANPLKKITHIWDGANWVVTSTDTLIQVTTANTAPTNNNKGDFWINNTNPTNLVTNIYDGTNWVAINANTPTRGTGAPTPTSPANPKAGDIYVDQSTGNIYTYNGSTWVNNSAGSALNVANGLTLITATNTIEMGGALTKPTVITTTTANTLAIEGLETGDVTQDDILTIDRTTNVVKKVSPSDFFGRKVSRPPVVSGKVRFEVPSTITDIDKISVYRNGVQVNFTQDGTNHIILEPEAKCYDGDEIKIVQFN